MASREAEGSPNRVPEPAGSSGIGIHSHLIILCALLILFTLAGILSFGYGRHSERELESSLKQNISLLTKLPELRGGIRQIDLLAELYFKTGETQWLEKRRVTVADVQDRYGDLKSLSAASPAQSRLSQFERELRIFLDRQQGMIQASRSKGSRPPDRQERDLLRTHRDNILEIISSFGDQAALEVQSREARVQSVSYRLYLMRLAFELLVAFLVIFYLLYYVHRPLRVVEEIATSWELGEPWPAQTLSSIPEIRNLITHFAQMAGRLNNAFGKAEELSLFKTKLVSVVSHEFGNSLAIIKSAAFLLEENLPPKWLEKNGQYFRMILSNVNELTGAVHNLLNMGRIEAGKLAVNFKATDAAEVLKGTLKRLELLCKRRNLRVSLDFPAGLQSVHADPATLTLVASNLLSNAIKYTPKNGRIVLGILRESSRPDHYRIYVQDTGIGISKQERSRILGGHGHFRTESGKRMTSKGFGIGLSLVIHIIEAHQSVLEIESSPGKGSRFSFLLPIHKTT